MVQESTAHGQLNTCSSAEGMPVEYAQYMADVLLLFFSPYEAGVESVVHRQRINGIVSIWHIYLMLPFSMVVHILLNWDNKPARLRGVGKFKDFYVPFADCMLRLCECRHGIFFSLCGLHSGRVGWLTWKPLFCKLPTDPVSLGTTFPEHWNDTIIYGGFLPQRSSVPLLCHWKSAKLKPLALNCRCTMLSHEKHKVVGVQCAGIWVFDCPVLPYDQDFKSNEYS